ncbi:PAS domain S-box protein [Bacillus sp. V5-8f]|uniref:PAS domain S-box protein n=1 Tax=Bacillus sp. V5-8f TaxID=2053044 RepID=UPI000C75BB35|nr:PAS domain S-box protein [Bacillus sp. V5-8f]PLT35045.1 PAS domain-containing sensor histidine kinase [Bacillus sp. V5-8f]
MDAGIVSTNPILLLVAVILTFIATYTALDLLTMLQTAERNKRFLFLGASFSMGIGIWTLNFFGVLAFDISGAATYNVPVAILSIVLGMALASMGFFSVTTQRIRFTNVGICSLLLTVALLSNYVVGMYSLNYNLNIHIYLLSFTIVLIFCLFLFAFMVLFYSNRMGTSNRLWFKPVSTFIITGAIAQGHLLLLRALPVDAPVRTINQLVNETPFIVYLVIFMSILILTGLLGSSAAISRRLAASAQHVKDIRSALDQSTIVAITDAQGIITYVNQKFIEISKYNEEELIGHSHAVINSGYHSKAFFAELWNTISKGRTWKGEICNKAKDGTWYWVDTTIVPFMKNGKPYQYISIRTDISNRKQAEESLKNSIKDVRDIHYALEQSSIVAFTDAKGIITQVNNKFCDISGYSHEELIGRNHNILNSGYHPKSFFLELWKTIGNGKVWKGEIKNRAKDGTYYWVDTTIVPFLRENGKPYQYLAIRNDITERKKTEEVLHRQDKLAAVGQLAAGVAHEIRNPLTSMKGYTEFLQLDESDPSRREFLDIILEEIERVNNIVEDFMVLAKPKAVHLEIKNIIPVVRNVVSLIEFEARKRNIHLHFHAAEKDEILVLCDENRLKQVFLNFLKNGMEAIPNGGTIDVAVQWKDGDVQISITDNGVGIPEDKLKRLGEPFYTTKKTGNGLGLMVSFRIIESHHGRVLVESELNKGTRFNIVLPTKTA